ncbi:MAG: helix-turn-helix transcriptional regulator [Marinifilaceae bacterium]|jgi:DNA-binding CsgD family transcriptional regulator|nr:helix-turn-helix transcriptional regulator [Marinifilaceae bacterium]
MKTQVVFIYSSELVSKALESILKEYFGLNMKYFSDIDDLYKLEYFGKYTLFIIEKKFEQEFNIFLLNNDVPNSSKIYFSHDFTQKEQADIYINSSIDKVKEIIDSTLRNNNQLEVHDESKDILTGREIEVLKLIAKGFSNKDIADSLFLSVHTVISHRKNIIAKLGIKSISGLTVYAILNNYVSPNEVS